MRGVRGDREIARMLGRVPEMVAVLATRSPVIPTRKGRTGLDVAPSGREDLFRVYDIEFRVIPKTGEHSVGKNYCIGRNLQQTAGLSIKALRIHDHTLGMPSPRAAERRLCCGARRRPGLWRKLAIRASGLAGIVGTRCAGRLGRQAGAESPLSRVMLLARSLHPCGRTDAVFGPVANDVSGGSS